MAANFCPMCGTPKLAPDAHVCRSCGVSFTALEANLAHMDAAGTTLPISRGRAALVTFVSIVVAIAYAWFYINSSREYAASTFLFLASFLAPFTVVAGFWYGILRLAHAQVQRVYVEMFISGIVFLVIPFHLVVEILSFARNQSLQSFINNSALPYYIMNIGTLVAVGSLIGIALASLFAPWDALRRPSTAMPRLKTVVPVYGSLLACIVIELWILFLTPENAELAGILYLFGAYVVTLIACIILPIIGYGMALSALRRP